MYDNVKVIVVIAYVFKHPGNASWCGKHITTGLSMSSSFPVNVVDNSGLICNKKVLASRYV